MVRPEDEPHIPETRGSRGPADETAGDTGNLPRDHLGNVTQRDSPQTPTGESKNERSEKNSETPAAPVLLQSGRYEIVHPLGKGGFGTVYLANDTLLHRQVAIKVPHRAPTDERAQAFLSEARRLARLQHPSIISVYDVGADSGHCYIVMELLQGESLASLLRKRRLSWLESAQLVACIAEALAHAHARIMIHRDIKPANIFITTEGSPVLLDFGLAIGDLEEEMPGLRTGTPAYMSPEQVHGRAHRVDGRTDIYSLGVVLYELLCGCLPFRASSKPDLYRRIEEAHPQPPRQLVAEIPAALECACLRAMSREMDERFTTAGDFAAAIRAVIPEERGLSRLTASAVRESDASLRFRREAELRHVTVLIFNFDVSDQGADAGIEERHTIRIEFAALVADGVNRLGGSMVSTGGEVMACFGYPIAFEDAATRAVRAALDILQMASNWGEDLRAKTGRIIEFWGGVHSGQAIAEDASGVSVEQVLLSGEARDTALRLERTLQPGAITISATTHARVRNSFLCESAGSQQPRGFRQPIELFRVIRENQLLVHDDLLSPANAGPLIGRDTEIRILTDKWELACEQMGQVVLLAGEPGMGKSRLAREIAARIRDDNPTTTAIELRCSSYHRNTEFFPLVAYLTHHLHGDDDRRPSGAWSKSINS